jgi:hypothetical protein
VPIPPNSTLGPIRLHALVALLWTGTVGRLNLKVNLPKERRALFLGNRLQVYWLALPGNALLAKRDYDKKVDETEVMAALAAIDRLLVAGEPIPPSRMQKVTVKGVALWEFKAPPRGRLIYRLLCHRGEDWEFYVAYAGVKKSQDLPQPWKEAAAARIKQSLGAGGP